MRNHLICSITLALLAGMASLSGCSESGSKDEKSGIAKIFSSDKDLSPADKARAMLTRSFAKELFLPLPEGPAKKRLMQMI